MTSRPAPHSTLLEEDAGTRPFHSPARWADTPAGELDRHDYRVDEYLIDGRAGWYVHDPGIGGAVIDPEHPGFDAYRTRAIVVRPRDASRFSGHVIVEGFNPSLGHDLSMLWSDVGGLAMADGDVFVGFSYKGNGIGTLKAADPERYGTLHTPSDRVQFDLVRDVLDLSRGPLLGDLGVASSVIATGGSQVSGLLHAFIAEGLHQPAGNGREFATADGYILNVSSGAFGPFGYYPLSNDRTLLPGETFEDFARHHDVPLEDPRRIGRGLEVPVVFWQSESEAVQEFWVGRPDSDALDDRYRCWQVVGRGHGSGIIGTAGYAHDWDQLRAAGVHGGFEYFTPSAPHWETAYILSAMVTGIRRWTLDGVPMPRVPRIELDLAPVVRRDAIGRFMTGVRIAVDELGHAKGGVRYPTIDVPRERFWSPPSESFIPDWRRDPMAREEVEERYGSEGRWRVLATSSLDDAIARGVVREDHRERFLQNLP